MIDDRLMRSLVEADRDALEGRGGSELARRVRENADVRAVAVRLLAALDTADGAIAHLAEERAATLDLRTSAARRNARSTGRLARPALGAAALAAAVLAFVLVTGPEPSYSPQPEAAVEPLTASLDVSSTRPFAVFATDNPDIAIVWLFDREEQ